MTSKNVTQSTDFWFDDGSIVVVVENTAFRIHKSILGKHSDVFAHLFTVPQPGDQDGDDYHSVTLHDSVDDFLDVLRALYQPFYFDTLPQNADLNEVISFISGILRISTKYNITILRNKCIDVLRTKFPSTLKGCDSLLSSGYKYASSTVVRAIPLGRETNVPEILPWAFYISTNIGLETLLEDQLLSWHDKTLCLAGKEMLWEVQKSITHRFMFEFTRAPGCAGSCRPRISQAMTWKRAEELREHPHPLNEFDEWASLNDVCSVCLESTKMQHKKGREHVWMELPQIFKLGSWEEIEKEQGR